MDNDINNKPGRKILQRQTLERDVLIQGEEILLHTRPLAWLKLGEPLVTIIIASAFLLVLPHLSKTYPEVGQVDMEDFWIILRWFGLFILAIGVIALVTRWFRWYFRIYIITNKRVIEGSGIIGRSYIDCSLGRIQNIMVRISILGRIFGYGTLRITTASNSKFILEWANIRNPLGIQRKINEAVESYMSSSTGKSRETHKDET